MSCNLNRLTTYNLGRVIHDNETGVYTAQLVNPPTSCPDTVFTSKKALVKVVAGNNPELIFDVAQQKPVIIVPRKEYIEQVGSSGLGFGFYFTVVVALGLLGVFFLYRRQQNDGLARSPAGTPPSEPTPGSDGGYTTRSNRPYGRIVALPSAAPAQQQQVAAPSAPSAPTTVINNNGSGNNDGLVTGLVLGSMLSNNRSSERVVERNTTIIEREAPQTFSSDSESSDDSGSSSDGGSFSSDSDSSSDFSSDSDSGSSYSSDSSSDSSFSSDSGSSDSGGGFSSDS